jgi:nickel/cobalt transporter (NicO) family protein
MTDAIIYLATSFWIGAVHAATPGHGKTIAAAYIVGARGKPVDAVILGVFVTLSHTSGIVLVGILASLGLPGMMPQRVEAWMALVTGLLVIGIGLWTLWTQRELMLQLQGVAPAPWHAHDHAHETAQAPAEMRFRPHARDGERGPGHHHHGHDHAHGHHHPHDHDHAHDHARPHHDAEARSHSHGWGFKHTHDLRLATTNRPSLWVLIGLGIAGGLLPDPAALAILLNALTQGKVMLGLGTIVVFSIGFASTLVIVGVIAAKVGQKILDWLAGPWAARLQISTSLLIVLVGVILSFKAWTTLSSLA